MLAARLDSAQPSSGLGYELDTIAAVVIGGASLSGGVGSIGGTAVGVLIIGVLRNGLNLLGVSPFIQQVDHRRGDRARGRGRHLAGAGALTMAQESVRQPPDGRIGRPRDCACNGSRPARQQPREDL